MVAWADRFDLEKQVVFYMSYHDNDLNKYIHFMCIWPIFITMLIMFASLEPLAEQPAFLAALPFGQYALVNPSCVLAGVYIAWYMLLDIVAGTLGAALVFLTIARALVRHARFLSRTQIKESRPKMVFARMNSS